MITTTVHVTRVGDVTLHEHHTEARFGAGTAGIGFAYRRPVAVDHSTGVTPIHDVVLRVRLVALIVVAIAIVSRRLAP